MFIHSRETNSVTGTASVLAILTQLRNQLHATQQVVSITGSVSNPNVKTSLIVSKTTRQFKDRLAEHRDNLKRDVLTEPSERHFNKNGHDVLHLRGLVLEKVINSDPYILKSREHMLTRKLDTFRFGLNQEP